MNPVRHPPAGLTPGRDSKSNPSGCATTEISDCRCASDVEQIHEERLAYNSLDTAATYFESQLVEQRIQVEGLEAEVKALSQDCRRLRQERDTAESAINRLRNAECREPEQNRANSDAPDHTTGGARDWNGADDVWKAHLESIFARLTEGQDLLEHIAETTLMKMEMIDVRSKAIQHDQVSLRRDIHSLEQQQAIFTQIASRGAKTVGRLLRDAVNSMDVSNWGPRSVQQMESTTDDEWPERLKAQNTALREVVEKLRDVFLKASQILHHDDETPFPGLTSLLHMLAQQRHSSGGMSRGADCGAVAEKANRATDLLCG